MDSSITDDLQIVRLVNPASFELVDIQTLIEDAFKSMADVLDLDYMLQNMALMALNPNIALFVGQENFKLNGLVMITPAIFFREPQVFHFYCNGTSKLRERLVESVVEWVKEQGYNGFWTSNINGDDKDKAFQRLFKTAGKAEKMGTIFRFEVS